MEGPRWSDAREEGKRYYERQTWRGVLSIPDSVELGESPERDEALKTAVTRLNDTGEWDKFFYSLDSDQDFYLMRDHPLFRALNSGSRFLSDRSSRVYDQEQS